MFCKGWDSLEHYIGECEKVKNSEVSFSELGRNKVEITEKLWDDELGEVKSKILGRVWKKKER